MSIYAWQLAPGSVAAAHDINGTIITGPMYIQIVPGKFDRVRDAIFDPIELYDQLDLSRFQGRAGLIHEIDRSIAGHDRGYVVVRGEAGVGKSALAAHLAWTRPCAYHFTRLGGGARNPVEARKSLAAQLLGGWSLGDRFAPHDVFPTAADRPDWLAKVLRAAAAERDRLTGARHPLVLVIDGLDEAEPDAPGMETGIPLGLPAPDALPPGVFIIATSRYGLPLAALQDPQRVGWTQITVEGADNLGDMGAFLYHAVHGPAPDSALTTALARHHVDPDWFAATLLERCRGVWIYLRYVLDDIRSGIREPAAVSDLPDRLRGYYLQQVDRWALSPAWTSLHRPALAALTALQRPVTASELAHVLPDGQAEPVKDQLAAWLDGPARAFLDVTRDTARRRSYGVRHQSLRDLFARDAIAQTDYPDDEPPEAGVGGQLHAAWIDANRAITESLTPAAILDSRDWASIDDYARVMFTSHAAAGGVLDELMLDPAFLLTFPPGDILRHRHKLGSREAIAAAAALEAATNEWAEQPDVQQTWWLHVWARKTGANALADALAEREPDWHHTVQAAFWTGTTHRIRPGHAGPVWSVATLPRPDGYSLLISGDGDGAHDGCVRIWDADNGVQLQMLTGHSGRVRAVAALPRRDGRAFIVSGGDDSTVRIWDPDTGLQLRQLNGHTGWVRSIAVLPGPHGRTLILSAGNDHTVRVWDPDTGNQVHALTGHLGPVESVAALVPQGGGALIISADGYLSGAAPIRIWDPDTGLQLLTLTGHTSAVLSVTTLRNPDGRTLIVSGSDDRTIRVWDSATGTLVNTIPTPVGAAWSIAELRRPNGQSLIISSHGYTHDAGIVRVWEPISGQEVYHLSGHTERVRSVTALPRSDGPPMIVSGGYDETIRLWDPDTRTQLHKLTGHTGTIQTVAAVADEKGRLLIISGGNDQTVRLWDPDRREQIHELHSDVAVEAVTALLQANGSCLIVGSSGPAIRVWTSDGAHLSDLIGHTGPVTSIAALLTPDGRTSIITGGFDRTVCLWNPETGDRYRTLLGHRGSVLSVAVLPRADGANLIVSGGSERTIRLWDSGTGTQLHELKGHTGSVASVAPLPRPDGNALIVSGGYDNTIRVWDPETGKQLNELIGHTGPVASVAPLPRPDGYSVIVSGGYDRTIRLWDADTGAQLDELAGHGGPVTAVTAALQNHEAIVVSASTDRTLLVWRIRQMGRSR
ncbi:hypothetical protein [Dactylosporangium sp. NPDC049140]|uniref:hypothetical protein n=1 Tax=Dactylosporangium sp. NPDC049140 TaxID=3155647 RepID=UPI0033F5B975